MCSHSCCHGIHYLHDGPKRQVEDHRDAPKQHKEGPTKDSFRTGHGSQNRDSPKEGEIKSVSSLFSTTSVNHTSRNNSEFNLYKKIQGVGRSKRQSLWDRVVTWFDNDLTYMGEVYLTYLHLYHVTQSYINPIVF